MKALSIFVTLLLAHSASAQAPDYDAAVKTFRTTLSELVKADTTNPPGNEERAVKILAKRFKDAGIPYEVVNFAPGRDNLIVRLKGSGEKKPLLLMAHIDVVGTKDQNWTTPPHEVTEKDGFLYGRGVVDDLGMAVVIVETMIMLKQANVKLNRDIVAAFTGDEESGGAGMRYLVEKRPEFSEVGAVLNEGGTRVLAAGKSRFFNMQVGEKIYQDFTLSAKGETGHSSMPKKDNSIYRLARALEKLANFTPEYRFIDVTRAYFKQRSKVDEGKLAMAMRQLVATNGKLPASALKVVTEVPVNASLLSTSCVATMLAGGTKVNALPPEATANVNCRLLPDENMAMVKQRLEKIINDPKVEVKPVGDFGSAPASPVTGEVPSALAEIVNQMWPGTPILPAMSTGATDSKFFRAKGIPAYGVMPIAIEESDIGRSHGIDERMPVASIRPGIEFFHKLVLRLGAI